MLFASIVCWLIGMAVPLILMLMGEPTERKMSEAFFSAINWNRRFIADIGFLPLIAVVSQLVLDAGSNPDRFSTGAGFQPFLRCSATTVVKMPPRT